MGGGTSSTTEFPPVIVPPNYGFNQSLYNQYLPGMISAGAPTFGGSLDPGMNATMKGAIRGAQDYASQAPVGAADTRSMLGQFMSGNLSNDWSFSPTGAEEGLSRFIFPGGMPPNTNTFPNYSPDQYSGPPRGGQTDRSSYEFPVSDPIGGVNPDYGVHPNIDWNNPPGVPSRPGGGGGGGGPGSNVGPGPPGIPSRPPGGAPGSGGPTSFSGSGGDPSAGVYNSSTMFAGSEEFWPWGEPKVQSNQQIRGRSGPTYERGGQGQWTQPWLDYVQNEIGYEPDRQFAGATADRFQTPEGVFNRDLAHGARQQRWGQGGQLGSGGNRMNLTIGGQGSIGGQGGVAGGAGSPLPPAYGTPDDPGRGPGSGDPFDPDTGPNPDTGPGSGPGNGPGNTNYPPFNPGTYGTIPEGSTWYQPGVFQPPMGFPRYTPTTPQSAPLRWSPGGSPLQWGAPGGFLPEDGGAGPMGAASQLGSQGTLGSQATGAMGGSGGFMPPSGYHQGQQGPQTGSPMMSGSPGGLGGLGSAPPMGGSGGFIPPSGYHQGQQGPQTGGPLMGAPKLGMPLGGGAPPMGGSGGFIPPPGHRQGQQGPQTGGPLMSGGESASPLAGGAPSMGGSGGFIPPSGYQQDQKGSHMGSPVASRGLGGLGSAPPMGGSGGFIPPSGYHEGQKGAHMGAPQMSGGASQVGASPLGSYDRAEGPYGRSGPFIPQGAPSPGGGPKVGASPLGSYDRAEGPYGRSGPFIPQGAPSPGGGPKVGASPLGSGGPQHGGSGPFIPPGEMPTPGGGPQYGKSGPFIPHPDYDPNKLPGPPEKPPGTPGPDVPPWGTDYRRDPLPGMGTGTLPPPGAMPPYKQPDWASETAQPGGQWGGLSTAYQQGPTQAAPWQGPSSTNDVYDWYAAGKKALEQDTQDAITGSLAHSGFSGNRYSGAAAQAAAREGARAQGKLSEGFMDRMFQQGEADIQRGFQGAESGLNRALDERLTGGELGLRRSEGAGGRDLERWLASTGYGYGADQNMRDRALTESQQNLDRSLQATGMASDVNRWAQEMGFQRNEANLARMFDATRMGMDWTGQYDQAMQNRLGTLFGAGQYQQDRMDDIRSRRYQDFERNKYGIMPYLPSFTSGAPVQQQDAIVRQTERPDYFGSLIGAAAASSPYWLPLAFGSDVRLKTNISEPVTFARDLPVRTWNWTETGEPGFGFIAQEVERVAPEAVLSQGGVKMIDPRALRLYLQ